MSFTIRLIRDNIVVNPVVRNIIRLARKLGVKSDAIANRYRIYGRVWLKVCGIEFKVYSASDDFIANEIYYDMNSEEYEFRLLSELLKGAGFFIDIGANTGIFSVWAAKKNPDVKVVSFEPHPANFSRLSVNASLNKLHNIELLPVAVGSTESTIEFTVPNKNELSIISSANADFTFHFNPGRASTRPVEKIVVKQVNLEKAFLQKQISRKDIVKIDVEYYELDVLQGMSRILQSEKPLILIEILDYNWLTKTFPSMSGKIDPMLGERVEKLLRGNGYFMYALDSEGITLVNPGDVHSGRNFLFSAKCSEQSHVVYADVRKQLIDS